MDTEEISSTTGKTKKKRILYAEALLLTACLYHQTFQILPSGG